MSTKLLNYTNQSIKGAIQVPGDKSISHRAVMFASMANGTSLITNFLAGEDCISTINAFRSMGVNITQENDNVTVNGRSIAGLKEPLVPINLGNSGTTSRLLLGILAGLPHHFTLFGDASLTVRPMDRIVVPLSLMGAQIDGREQGKYLPLAVRGKELNAITYHTPVKSAQVKSGVLLAGLLANGTTVVEEDAKTRDHTENMLQAFGVKLEIDKNTVSIEGKQQLTACDIQVPGDISSAAFFLVATALAKNSKLTIDEVGLNPTRTGILDVLKMMDVDIDVVEEKTIGGELIGSIKVQSSDIKATTIEGDIIPRIIDEIPIIALLATQASGKTIIKDAEELRFKETDRIASVVENLKALGANIEPTNDGMIINGPTKLKANKTNSYGDHRIGMMVAIASLIAEGTIELSDAACISVSYPRFFEDLDKLIN
ncbi:3-phosphoshikimate 1-carboxyvinyltransferase [Saliterribacillus persicus]|uniref:3-phosphoshikimate 1-carboxyvinyltransferase n=1 Tax=Saliterribacillus persicus TaxID=930114 RepID=A0A368XAE2_9BACI|nr:3-phosphoshikimate 1-carboxyvinyltransferase [Saliterribacillus persicus]